VTQSLTLQDVARDGRVLVAHDTIRIGIMVAARSWRRSASSRGSTGLRSSTSRRTARRFSSRRRGGYRSRILHLRPRNRWFGADPSGGRRGPGDVAGRTWAAVLVGHARRVLTLYPPEPETSA
jgi:hypothetical protein